MDFENAGKLSFRHIREGENHLLTHEFVYALVGSVAPDPKLIDVAAYCKGKEAQLYSHNQSHLQEAMDTTQVICVKRWTQPKSFA